MDEPGKDITSSAPGGRTWLAVGGIILGLALLGVAIGMSIAGKPKPPGKKAEPEAKKAAPAKKPDIEPPKKKPAAAE